MGETVIQGQLSQLEKFSPEWWLLKLDAALAKREPLLGRYEDYYSGNHPMSLSSPQFKEEFRKIFFDSDFPFNDNWCELVVDATEERLNVEGFRWDPESDQGDKDAWKIWQENQLDLYSQIGHTEALVNMEAYALVSPTEKVTNGTAPLITIEHPTQMIADYAPGTYYGQTPRAAFKRWRDDDDYVNATVYLPNETHKFRSEQKLPNDHSGGNTRWIRRPMAAGESNPVKHTLGVVPVVALCNRPRLIKPPSSELHKVIPIQNAVNKVIMDGIVASEFLGWPQRVIMGFEQEEDEKTGEKIQPFRSRLDRWLMLNGTDPEHPPTVTSLPEARLSNFIDFAEGLLHHLAAQSRTPPHYFYTGAGQWPSGEAIKSAETGLVSKVIRKQRFFGEGWEAVMRLAFKAMGDSKYKQLQSETIWRDPESRTEGEHVDATLKKETLGVPWSQLMEDAGYTPQQIERMKVEREEEGTAISIIDPTTGDIVQVKDRLARRVVPGGTDPSAEVVPPAGG